jgi:hypothetical protein
MKTQLFSGALLLSGYNFIHAVSAAADDNWQSAFLTACPEATQAPAAAVQVWIVR